MSNSDIHLLALGELDDREREAIEAELADSAELQSELAAIDATLAELAHAAPALEPSAGLRDRLLASTDPETPWEGFVTRLTELFDLAADRVREIMRAPADAWTTGEYPNAALLHFDGGPRLATADCGLVRIAPNASFPHHSHGGDEWSLILSGRAEEDTGVIWEPGDLIHTGADKAHTFRALGEEPFVFAVVLEAPIALTSPE